MPVTYLDNVNLAKNELQNARIQNLASPPASPVAGQVYYDTGTNTLQFYNGTTWGPIGSSISPATTVTAMATFGLASVVGTATTYAREDHRHSTPAAPTASSVGAVANAGNATSLQTGTAASRPTSGQVIGNIYADSDDFLLWIANSTTTFTQLAAFGAVSTTTTVTGAANGTATTYARSDHNHNVSAGTPGNSAVGDAAAAGTATSLARSDHVHGRESFGTVTAQTTFGAASGNGVATTDARSDHTHGTPTHVGTDHSAISISSLSAPTADVSWGSHKITNLLDPTSAQDAATKNYVDTVSAGLLWKSPVRAATTAALAANTYANGAAGVGATLTANANGALAAVDGQTLGGATSQAITAMTNAGTTVTATVASNANLAVGQIVTVTGAAGFTTNNPNGQWTIASLVSTNQFTFVANLAPTGSYTASSGTAATLGDRVLVQNEATAANNGIYVVTQVGTAALPYILTRATDNNTNTEMEAAAVFAVAGTVNARLSFNCTNTGGITIGTTAITWVAFTGASTATAGAGLTATGNVFAVGAGTGISVAADSVAIDTTVVVRKFAANVGNGSLTSITVNHALGTQDVTVEVYQNSSTWDKVYPSIQHTDANNVTLIFAVAPTASQYRCVVHG